MKRDSTDIVLCESFVLESVGLVSPHWLNTCQRAIGNDLSAWSSDDL